MFKSHSKRNIHFIHIKRALNVDRKHFTSFMLCYYDYPL